MHALPKLLLRTSLLIILAFLFASTPGAGQDVLERNTEDKNIGSRPHRLTLLMANAVIPAANNIAGQNSLFIVPAWGINYDYWFSHKIGLGLHNSIILQQYKIEESREGKIVERSFPVIVSGEFLFKPVKKLTLSLGAGRELEKHESYTVINAGIEYGFELPHHWELGLTLLYDNKHNAYDSWMLGVGFSKFLPSTYFH